MGYESDYAWKQGETTTLILHSNSLIRFKELMSGFTGGPSPDGEQMLQVAIKGAETQTKLKEGAKRAGGAEVLAGAAVIGAVGTGVVASTIGLPMVGVLAVGGGLATAGAAAFGSGDKSDVARTAGKMTAQTAKNVKSFDNQHDISGKTVRTAKAAAEKANEFDKKHQVTATIAGAAKSLWSKANDVNAKYDITGRAGRGLSTGLDPVSKALEGDGEKKLTDGAKT